MIGFIGYKAIIVGIIKNTLLTKSLRFSKQGVYVHLLQLVHGGQLHKFFQRFVI